MFNISTGIQRTTCHVERYCCRSINLASRGLSIFTMYFVYCSYEQYDYYELQDVARACYTVKLSELPSMTSENSAFNILLDIGILLLELQVYEITRYQVQKTAGRCYINNVLLVEAYPGPFPYGNRWIVRDDHCRLLHAQVSYHAMTW